MKDIIRLTKIYFINGLHLDELGKESLKNKRFLLMIFVIFMVGGSFIRGYNIFVDALITTYVDMGRVDILMNMVYHSSLVSTFMLIIPYALAVFLLGQDLEFLRALPIKGSRIMASKFLTLYVPMVAIVLVVVGPIFIKVSQQINVDLWFYGLSVLVLIILPLGSLCFCSFIIILIGSLFKNRGNQRVARVLSSIMMLVLVLLISVYSQRFSDNQIGKEQLKNFFITAQGYLGSRQYINILGNWFSDALLTTQPVPRILALLYYVGINALIAGLFYLGSGSLYTKILRRGKERRARSGQQTKNICHKERKKRRRGVALVFTMDLQRIFKTPFFLYSCYGTPMVMMLAFILPLLLSKGMTFFTNLGNMYQANEGQYLLTILVFICFINSLNTTACTSFSREGSNRWIMATLPLKVKDQILGRALTAFLPQFLTMVIVISVLTPFVPMLGWVYLELLGVCSLVSVAYILVGLAIDAKKPVKEWQNPQQAVKLNPSVLKNIFTLYGFILVAFGGATLLYITTKQILLGLLLIVVIAIIAGGFALIRLPGYVEKAFKD